MLFGFFEKLIHPYPDQLPHTPPKNFFAFLWVLTRGVRRYVLALMLLTAAIGAFEALLFSMLGKVVDWLSKLQPSQLWQDEQSNLLLLGGILLASILVVTLQTILKHQTISGNFPMLLRWNFHRHMLRQSLYFYQDEFSGRISAKVMQTAIAVRDTVLIVADIMVYILIYFITMGVVITLFDWWLLLPFGLWLSGYGLTLWYFVPRLSKVAAQQADARSLMAGRITDAYTNIATVKLFSHGQREASYARGAMQEFMQSVHRQMRFISNFEIINQILSVTMIAGTAWTGLWLWSHGQIGVGAVAAAIAIALRLNGIAHWIMWEMSTLFEQVGTVKDGLNTLSRELSVVDKPDAKTLVVQKGEVRFEHVNFSYGNTLNVIHDLSLVVRPGEKIGLVGRSGAGKSTIVNLLLRFYDIDSGRILIDGQDISSVTQESLRAQIGMVTQDTSLLHRSVRDNLLYGRPDADVEAMIAAARNAEADEFIQTLSDSSGRRGYDAHVGERGVKLSGGQRQRIAIARVMLKDAPILLLDEATSALDSEVEVAIQSSLYRLMEGKTVIAIAHRLSTIAAMDRLIVLDQGQIVEQGSHKELLAQNGIYARLWAHQSGGFLGDEDDNNADSNANSS